ncbi:MAG: hypothetical protein ACREFZ_08510, partial [Acetobacteraceae bacterium]
LNERLDAELKAAEARIAAARNAAMSAIGAAARETAEALIERLAGRVPEPAMLESALGHALARRLG